MGISKLRFLKPEPYTIYSVFVSLGGILNGYDTGSIGAVTLMPFFEKDVSALSPVMRGFTVSLIMLAGAMPAFFAGQLADQHGRLLIVGIGATVFMAGTILQGSAYILPQFWVGRALCGLGEGLWLSNVSVYITEIAPKAKRGALVSIPQLGSATGICLGYFTCYGSVHIQSTMSWRIPYIVQALLAFILAISCLTVFPNSPRWLMQKNRREEAAAAVERLNIPRAEAEKDILAEPESTAGLDSSAFKGLTIIFRKKYRSRTLLALFVLGMVQLSGIDGVLYYAPILFAEAGLDTETAGFLASGVSAILMLAVSIPAIIFADSWGRRTSIITGGVLLSGTMFLVGSLYAAGAVHAHGVARWVVVASIFIYALSYCTTWGVTGKIYASEIQPARTRAAANCVAQGLNFLTNWLIAFATPVFLANSAYGAYFLFGGLSLGTLVVLFVYMPETKGAPLEDIQERFEERASVTKGIASGVRRLTRRVAGKREASWNGWDSAPHGSYAMNAVETDARR